MRQAHIGKVSITGLAEQGHSGCAPSNVTELRRPVFGSIAGRKARFEIQARVARTRFFKASLFSDPAWDILLELFAAEHEGRRVSISTVGLTAGIPATTSLRWVNVLEEDGLVERTGDPHDARRTFLSLSEGAQRAMTLYLER